MFDWIKVVAGIIGLATTIIEWRKREGDEMGGYNKAVTEGAIAMYKSCGRVDVIISDGAQLTPEDKRKVLKDD